MTRSIFVSIIVLSAWFGAEVYAQPKPARPSASETRDLESQLKASVQDIAVELAEADTFKKSLLTDELATRFRRFVTEFKRSGNRVSVQVDRVALERFLEFRAVPQGAKLAVRVLSAPNCKRCEQASSEVSKSILTRLNKRGFKSQASDVITGLDQGAPAVRLNAALQSALQHGYTGVVWVQLENVPPDPESAHPDEELFFTRVGLSTSRDGQAEFSGFLELESLASEPLAPSADKLLTDLFVEAGAKFTDARAAQTQGPKASATRYLVRVKGVGGYPQYLKLLEALGGAAKESGFLFQEKELSRGVVVFEITSEFTKEQLDLKLSSTKEAFSSTQWNWE
jgi:hypothetical protein